MNNITLHPYPKPTREEGLLNPDNGKYYYITLPYTPGCNEYEWHTTSTQVIIDDNNGSDAADICFRTDGQVIVYVYAINACGKSRLPDHIYVFASNYGGYSATYPNPARDILTVDLDAAVSTRQQPAAASRNAVADYDLRLYDGQGNLLRSAKTKGGTVQFNVANLPDGIYYLHIYDGVNPKPEIQQIAVEH